jgi:Arc/MetJ-type ribon-helix-helix transcriptional regulator
MSFFTKFIYVNISVYKIVIGVTQVQVRMPEKLLTEIDHWVAEGRFKSRSDAIKTILSLYEERERTREFYELLVQRQKEAKEHPETLVPLEEIH